MVIRALFQYFQKSYPLPLSTPIGNPTPNSERYLFLEEGHVMEVLRIGETKAVSLFFGPGEFIVPSYPKNRDLITLDTVKTESFSYGGIIRLLHNHPSAKTYYRELRKSYLQKVVDRLGSLQFMTSMERLIHLERKQPWVFQLADEKDIANYLGISLETYHSLYQINGHP